MSASAGSGGLGTLGWVAVAGAVSAAGLAGVYFSGLLQPDPEPAAVTQPAPAPEASQEPGQDPGPEPVASAPPQPEPAAPQAPATEAPEPVPVPEPEPVAAAETDPQPATDPEPAAEPEPQPPAAETAVETAALAVPDAQTTEQAETTPEPTAAPAPQDPASQAADEPTDEPTTGPALLPPSFDLVRVETDGTTVIAGKGTAGSQITVLLDEAELDRFEVDSGGAFVAFLQLPLSDRPRLLTLLAELAGQKVLSTDQIILAPSPRPEPEPEPEPEPQAAQLAQSPAAPEPADPSEDALQSTEAPTETAAPQPQETALSTAAPQDSQPRQESRPEPRPESRPAEDAAAPAPLPEADTAPAAQAETETAETTADPAPEPTPAAPEVASDPTQPEAPGAIAPDTTAATAPQPRPEPEPAPVAVLRAGSGGVELIQPANPRPPEVMDKIALDTISYSDAGEVQLSGRSQGSSTVRVYLDNEAVADLNASPEGRWAGALPGVDPGIYTLRLDELNDAGEVISRLETPFKREAPEALRPPPPPQGVALDAAPLIRAVTVQKGDTLWAISRDRYGEGVLYVRVFEANRDSIRDPDLIYPGQVFALPE